MFIGWSMAGLRRNKRMAGKAARLSLAAAALVLAAGCALLPPEEEQEALPQIKVPTISQKPEYAVERGDLELQASGAGKLMSEREENLVFTRDNLRVTEVLVKAGDVVKKGQVLARLDAGDAADQIRRKEIELEKFELDLKAQLRTGEQDELAVRKLQLDRELLLAELDELREQIAEANLLAPYGGTIVSFAAEKGDLSRAYEKVGRIADLNERVVAVQFGTTDLANIAPNMDVTVSLNALGDFKGKVRRLPVDGAESDSLDAYTLIDLDGLPDEAAPGTPLSAAVTVDRRAGTLIVPIATVRKQNDRNYVIVANPDGSKGEVDVQIGLVTAAKAEIIDGLEEGQKVVGK